MQLPPTAKHPEVRLIPVPKVLVAVVLMFIVLAPVFPRDRVVPGEVVPMPTFDPKYALPVVVAPPDMVSPPA
jgi:hypothetical protein